MNRHIEIIDAYPIPGFREPFSSFSHLIAAAIFAVLSYYLIGHGRGSVGRRVSLATMALASVFLLSMSSIYHLLSPGTARHILRQIDIAAVFVLIAGTVTPVHAILFKGFHRWVPIFVVWMIALSGIVLRIILGDSLPRGIGTVIFLVFGWGGVISCVILWRRYGFSFIRFLLWGGMAYTVGAAILLMRWPILIPGVIGAHELWHIAVLIGLGMHWRFVFKFASGPPDVRLGARVDSTTRTIQKLRPLGSPARS